MAVVGIIVALMAALAPTANAQPTDEKYLALQYAVHVSDSVVGASEIRPRYLWLDDHRLVIPIREVVEERRGADLQNIDIFVADLIAGTVVRVASYDEVFGVSLTPSRDNKSMFFSPMVVFEIDASAPTGVRREYERFVYSIESGAVYPTTPIIVREQRAAITPRTPRPYSETLARIAINDFYRGRNVRNESFYDWEQWGEYIVGIGASDGTDPTDPSDLRLYRPDGSTAHVLPSIQVYSGHLHLNPTILQVSPGGQFLFLNENTATWSTRNVLRMPNRQSIIYIYGFVDEDPTEHYDTVVYAMDSEGFGEGYEIGEVFELERRIVDGSVLSTGPVQYQALAPEERP